MTRDRTVEFSVAYFTERALTAEEAAAWGLITRVVRDKDLASEAESAARRLAAGPGQDAAAGAGPVRARLIVTANLNMPHPVGRWRW
jgi:enoyl-CoA hydratase/carnithine racemase